MSGTYTIAEPMPGQLRLHVSWQSEPGGAIKAMEFGGPSDGTACALPLPAGVTEPVAGTPDALTLTRVDEATLDSAALSVGQLVAYARRIASADGQLLAVVQETALDGGQRTRNFQVYRRTAGPNAENVLHEQQLAGAAHTQR